MRNRLPGSNSRPNVPEGYEVPLSYRGDRQSRILCTNDLIVLHPLGIFSFSFSFLVRKFRLPGSNSRPNVSEGYMVTSELPGRPVYCVCVFSSHQFWTSTSLDVPAGVTQEEGHTGFFVNLLSAVRASIFLARRIQPFLPLVDREVEFCVLTI